MRALSEKHSALQTRTAQTHFGASVTALPGRSGADAALMVRIQANGDRSALDNLARHYAPRLKSWLMARGEQAQTAEDIAQDVFILVWTKAALFDADRGCFSTWVYRMTRNRWIDHKRKHDRLQPTAPETLSIMADAPVDAADAQYDRAEASQAVKRELAMLSTEQKQILHLAFFEGLSHSQIAERTGLPLGTVKSRIRAPLKKMRAGLEDFRGVDQ